MGPAAWAAVRSALTRVLAVAVLKSRPDKLIAAEVKRLLAQRDLELSRALARDLRARYRDRFDQFIKKYASELSPEELRELDDL